MNNQISIFRAVFLTFSLSLFIYISHQLFRNIGLSPFEHILYELVIFIPFLLFVIQPLYFWTIRGRQHTNFEETLTRLGFISLSYLNYLLVLVVGRDLLGFVLDILNQPNFGYNIKETQIMLIMPVLFSVIGYFFLKWGPRLSTVDIHHPEIPLESDQLKILQISDLHIGLMIGESYVNKVIEKINLRNPDLVVLTGDIVDGHPERHLPAIKSLSQIKSKYGSYYIPGNHEYYWNFQDILKHLKDQGITILLNSGQHFHDLNLSLHGVADLQAGYMNHDKPDLQKAMQSTPQHHFKVLLSHQSKFKEIAQKHGIHFQISGHTHGGQFFPWNFLIYIFDRYSKGLYEFKNFKMYVNPGTGFWGPPDRLGTISEITEFILKRSTK